MNSNESGELLAAFMELEDGSIDPRRRDELMAELERSPAARRAYLEYFQHSAVLKMEGAKMHERGLLPVIDSSVAQRRLFQRSMLAAAAVIALVAAILGLVAISQPGPDSAKVTVAADTLWSVDSVAREEDRKESDVTEGSTVRVMSGIARLELESGATLAIQGPAEVRFPKLNQPDLVHGMLWFDSGTSDDSFELKTPELIVRDIGTRFGVRVPEQGAAEIHLIEGELQVLNRKQEPVITSLKPDGKAREVPLFGEPSEKPLAEDPFPDLAELLEADRNYPTTVRGQSPLRYWRFEDDRRGHSDSTESQVIGGEPGVGSNEAFHGFDHDNRCLRLIGTEDDSLVAGPSETHEMGQREGAVSFWIRREPGITHEEILWLVGPVPEGKRNPQVCLVYTSLAESGRVRMFIKNDGADVVLASSRSVADGRWHHIAASWGTASAELFVDGQSAAADHGPRGLTSTSSAGSRVRFGKPSEDLTDQGAKHFRGWVDEIAMWSRPLTPAEVSRQYEAAIGTDGE
ncbi:hypothetical protein HAHE_16610 [Haloferula helveola]|uniref:FecR protein domain-containing protein n=1 Tax=Haloferula helveola TaxID=490095 RepID=A0ABM7RDM4_9BACT|nr:hypothetical protein HAHE_16610 [Haloferula helveola]